MTTTGKICIKFKANAKKNPWIAASIPSSFVSSLKNFKKCSFWIHSKLFTRFCVGWLMPSEANFLLRQYAHFKATTTQCVVCTSTKMPCLKSELALAQEKPAVPLAIGPPKRKFKKFFPGASCHLLFSRSHFGLKTRWECPHQTAPFRKAFLPSFEAFYTFYDQISPTESFLSPYFQQIILTTLSNVENAVKLGAKEAVNMCSTITSFWLLQSPQKRFASILCTSLNAFPSYFYIIWLRNWRSQCLKIKLKNFVFKLTPQHSRMLT